MAFTFPSDCIKKQTFRGVEFRELVGSGDFDFGSTQGTTRRYIVDWVKALELAQALVGFVVSTGPSSAVWNIPHQDPERNFLFAARVRGSGVGTVTQDTTTGAIVYDRAILDVDYEPLPNEGGAGATAGNFGSITFVTERSEAAAFALTLPKKKFLWASGSKKGLAVADDAVLFKKIPQKRLTIDIHWWFSAPVDLTFEKLLGSVNKKSEKILLTTYPKGTLRFDHTSRVRQFTSAGVEGAQVTHQFTWQVEEHNKKFFPTDDKFIFVESAKGRRIHDEIDFKPLFPR